MAKMRIEMSSCSAVRGLGATVLAVVVALLVSGVICAPKAALANEPSIDLIAQSAEFATGNTVTVSGTLVREEAHMDWGDGVGTNCVYYVVELDEETTCSAGGALEAVSELQVGRVLTGTRTTRALSPHSEMSDASLEPYVGRSVNATGTLVNYSGTFMWTTWQLDESDVVVEPASSDVPDREKLESFLIRLLNYYNGSSENPGEYDSEHAAEYADSIIANMLASRSSSVADLSNGDYPVTLFIDDFVSYGSGNDPADPLDKFGMYTISDADAVEWITRNIFNVSSADYLKLRDSGDKTQMKWHAYYYYQGRYYAETSSLVYNPYTSVELLSIEPDESRYNVHFRSSYVFTRAPSPTTVERELYAQVEWKEIDGAGYWTLYKLSEHPLDSTASVMHRLYNPYSGEHFYTASVDERDWLVSLGWRYEGVGWTAPASSNTPVFRMYNSYAGEHHYCTSEDERDGLVDAGWSYEGIGWYSDDAKSVPLYRDYNPNAYANNHNYTTDREEHEWLLSLGWRDEGLAWYGI